MSHDESIDHNTCSSSKCVDVKDNDKFKLTCSDCKRSVHYKCTKLPVYHIQQLLDVIKTRKGNKFKCVNCVDIDKELYEHMKERQDENESTPQGDNPNNLRNIRNLRNMNNELLQEVKEKEKLIESFEERQAIDEIRIASLKEEVEIFKNKVKSEKDSQNKLRDLLLIQKEELNELTRKFAEVGNPDFDTLMKLEETLAKKLDKLEKTLIVSIKDQIQQNNIQVEHDIKQLVTESKTYADTLKIVAENTVEGSYKEPMDIRGIVREAKNEEIAEENEKKRRSCNIVLHGVTESEKKEDIKTEDVRYVRKFIETVDNTATFKTIFRIGNSQQSGPEQSKKRPIMVVMTSETEKEKIMGKLNKLKNKEEFSGVSVTEDYTIAERELIREFNQTAKNKNSVEDPNYVWKVRGNPKNGLTLMKFRKRNQ